MAALPAQGFLSPSQWAGPQKKGGGGCARNWRSPEDCGWARPASHAPFSDLPSGRVAPSPRPAPLALTLKGAEESAYAQAQFTAQAHGDAEVRLRLARVELLL